MNEISCAATLSTPRTRRGTAASLLLVTFLAAANASAARPGPVARTLAKMLGTASWHGGNGDRTASGERWQTDGLMAAHRSLPLGSKVRVINVKNGRSTVVRITDRGPYAQGRIIDLSRAAARAIGITDGLGQVRLETLPAADEKGAKPSKPSA